MELTANHVVLRGSLGCLPQFSHENHGRRFFQFSLVVIIAQEEILNEIGLSDGEMLTVTGQVRSHNLRENGRRRLLIFVFASGIICEDGAPINEVTLEGPLCREPTYCDVMLAVPRPFRRADYLPCILWGKTAQECAQLHTRDVLQILGRLQSRAYTKVTETGSESRTAYEISALEAYRIFPEEENSGL